VFVIVAQIVEQLTQQTVAVQFPIIFIGTVPPGGTIVVPNPVIVNLTEQVELL